MTDWEVDEIHKRVFGLIFDFVNPLGANLTKWLNILSVFDHFVE